MRPGVTVVVPTIPPRSRSVLPRALESVWRQSRVPEAVVVTVDRDHAGAGPNRWDGVLSVRTEWLAFLDDDDELLPQHLQVLCDAATQSGADVVFPWFTVVGGTDPFPMHFGRQWDPADPHIFPITALVRTELALDGDPFPAPTPPDADGNSDWHGDDFPFWVSLSRLGATFLHVPERTWIWHHWGYGRRGEPGNTSGLPSRW